MSEERARDQRAHNVLFLVSCPSRDEAVKLIDDIWEDRRDTPLQPVRVGVWSVGRRPVLKGELIELGDNHPTNPGGLPDSADLEYGIEIYSGGEVHYVEKVSDTEEFLVCLSAEEVRFADKAAEAAGPGVKEPWVMRIEE